MPEKLPEWRSWIFFFAMLTVSPAPTFAEDASPFAERLTRWLSAAQRNDERTLRVLRDRLQELPPLSSGHSGENGGFHSRFQAERTAPLDLVIDLGKLQPVDRIAVFPVRGMFRGATLEGYGFPERFVIELAQDSQFSNPVLHYDSKDAEAPPLPDYPMQIVLPQAVDARFLRLRILEHWTREDGRFLSALGEIMVLANGRNVALHSSVSAVSFAALPDWDRDHLVDGQTDLGLPVGPEPSPTNGFLSKGQAEPIAEKWVQLNLPRSVLVDEVVLIPAQPVDAPDQFGHGFPRRFRLLVADDPDFASASVIADFQEMAYPNPGDNPAVFPASGIPARFVRLEVNELWHITNARYSITLAELQVIESGQNMALNAEVTASDVFSRPAFEAVWKPEYLVDGFSSQNRLIALEPWLAGLEEREEVERHIEGLESKIAQRSEQTLRSVLGFSAIVLLASLALTGLLIFRRKRALAEQQETIRARIARDLHDDLGSRLGGMRLLSENLLGFSELPEEFRGDLELLNRSSSEASDAIRDIVWLLDNREGSLGKLRQQMRRLVPSLLGSIPFQFEVAQTPEAKVGFEFRRQVLLAFRESVSNAARHSGTDSITCRVGGDAERFWFEVRDRGKGFSEDIASPGYGVLNLRKRAEALQGEVEIQSRPTEGTTVTFNAPYRQSRKA
ncbi:MAG: ATP-binding protein [Verrucomicrobiota bacterium]